jgi:hypothetical protein
MKSAEEYIQARRRGLNHQDAMAAVAEHPLYYIDRVPSGVYRTVQISGSKIFPIFENPEHANPQKLIQSATNNLSMIRNWARHNPEWAIATGAAAGVFAVQATGVRGPASLLRICQDDWGWLATLRVVKGDQRHIFFTWPAGLALRLQSAIIAPGLRLVGEGGSVLLPSSATSGATPFYFADPQARILDAPDWLVRLAFTVDRAEAKPPRSVGLGSFAEADASEQSA